MKILCQLAVGLVIGCALGYKSIYTLIRSNKENNK